MGVALREEYTPVCDRCHVGFQDICVCVISDGKRDIKREVIVPECLQEIFFTTHVPAVQTKGAWSEPGVEKNRKWDVNFKLLPLLFINRLLCPFSADVSVTRAVTVSNELHLPLHFIYRQSLFTVYSWLMLVLESVNANSFIQTK